MKAKTGPDFPMVIEVFAEPGQELLLGGDTPIESETGDPLDKAEAERRRVARRSPRRIRMNAQDLLRQARERSPDLFENLCLLIEASYLGVVNNQRPWGM